MVFQCLKFTYAVWLICECIVLNMYVCVYNWHELHGDRVMTFFLNKGRKWNKGCEMRREPQQAIFLTLNNC